MQEFASVSHTSHAALTEALNEKTSQGWSLVGIHALGSELVAFLSRDKKTAAQPAVETATEASPVAEPAGWASAPAAAPADIVTATPAAAPAAAQPAAARTGNPPANWYTDPSGRFELRYWDGNTWTEHVSRGGQQYTDPPVA